jgi:hypothetical protein
MGISTMDDKTHFSVTLILMFIIGVIFGVGNRVVAESNGREIKTGDSALIDLMLIVFWFVALGYTLAIVWHIKLLSLVFVVIVASVLIGSSYGSKLAPERNQTIVRIFLFCSGVGVPSVFHLFLS